MSWFDNLFARQPDGLAATAAPLPASFAEQATASLERFQVSSRRAAASLSPAAYSSLRRIADHLRPVIAHAQENPILPEREAEIMAIITDYAPTSVELFLRLPAHERLDEGRGDRMLQEQLVKVESATKTMATRIEDDSFTALAAQAIFIDMKYRHPGS
ncbi:hypothetical protein ACFVAJ_18355 [Agromyces sp. NPDC057679]|uniref:hypothetical protein n=1 Tax=Agromyces sp. NPDC057679 TaxID=3346207 RepID=UPI00366ADC68